MDLNLKDFQTEFHKDVLLLQKINNFIIKRLEDRNRLGAPEGPYILEQLNSAIMSFRIKKPATDKIFSPEQLNEVLRDSIKYLNYLKNDETKASHKEKINSLLLDLLKH